VLTAKPAAVDYTRVEADGVQALGVTPAHAQEDRVLLCIHGGGFVSGSIYTHRKLFAHLAKAIGVRALIIEYTLLPDGGAYPVPLEQALTAYRWLIDQGINASHMAMAADSAAASLAIGTQLRARDESLELPAATLLMSPWVDFEVIGETMQSNAASEALFTPQQIKQLADAYRGDTSAQDPHITPLYGDLSGFGPIYIQVGDQEVLLADGRRLAERARHAGVEVRLDIFPEMQHTFQMMAGRAPEADDAINRFAEWTNRSSDSAARPPCGLPDAQSHRIHIAVTRRGHRQPTPVGLGALRRGSPRGGARAATGQRRDAHGPNNL
jgi:epsilon-lactone hydrolase